MNTPYDFDISDFTCLGYHKTDCYPAFKLVVVLIKLLFEMLIHPCGKCICIITLKLGLGL